MTYRYDKDLSTSKWTIMIDTVDNYGYFERNSDGTGGGLWFDPCGPNGRTELIDYDGVPIISDADAGLASKPQVLNRIYIFNLDGIEFLARFKVNEAKSYKDKQTGETKPGKASNSIMAVITSAKSDGSRTCPPGSEKSEKKLSAACPTRAATKAA